MEETKSDASDRALLQIDEAVLEERVREEITRQLKHGKAKATPELGRKAGFDPARLREAVRREVRRQFGIATDVAAAAPSVADVAIDSELLRAAIQRVLSRRLHRQGERGEPGEETPSEREVSPAVLEPLVRKEMERLLGRGRRAPELVAAARAVDSSMLRERIQEAIAARLHTGKERSDAQMGTLQVTSTDRAVIAKQIRAVLKRCLSRPALPEGKPLSDEAIDGIVKGALRGLPARR